MNFTVYYIVDYYTGKIIATSTNVNDAISLSRQIPDSTVSDEAKNIYYTNVELPF